MSPIIRRLLLSGLMLSTSIALPSAVVGCGPYVLISNYDAKTDDGVTALQKEVDDLLDQLAQTPVPEYASIPTVYKSIHGDFAVLYSRNQLRQKNTVTLQQLDALKKELDDLETAHKSGKFIALMAGPARDSLDQTFRAILKLELEKKELKE